MKTKLMKTTMIVATSLAAATGANAALLLINGDFEAGSWVGSAPASWNGSNGSGLYGEIIAAPINYSGGTIVAALRPVTDNYYQQTIGLLSDGAAGVTINLDAGIRSHNSYENTSSGRTQTMEISLWNTTTNMRLEFDTFTMVSPAVANAVDLTAQEYTINYDATGIEGNDLALRFQNVSNTGGNSTGSFNILIDNVTVTAVPVPEPSSAALLGLGGLALILRRRK